MSKKISIPLFIIMLGSLALSFSNCNKTKSCPAGNLCVEGNTFEYQLRPTSAKLIIEVPEGAVYGNAAVTITDMVPAYPANADFGDFDRHFAGGFFNIEPNDLPLKQLIRIAIEYPGSGIIDEEDNNYEEELRLWFIDKDDNWSIFPSSECDAEKNQVFAWVKKLGKYAVAAEKECIVGEWRQGDTIAEFPYYQRVMFNIDGTGRREFINDCGSGDWNSSGENFKWSFTSGLLDMYNFTAKTVCDTISFTTPDRHIEYECTGPTLFLGDLPPVTYTRF
ncbi:MAG: hypothetical protein U9R19_00060 [Bacteroidota bacterium]|nr:hypothetical protein [Bacteroidota bacterium]